MFVETTGPGIMSTLFNRNSAVERRLKKIQKELSSVDNDLQSLSRAVKKPGEGIPMMNARSAAASEKKEQRPIAGHKRVSSGHDSQRTQPAAAKQAAGTAHSQRKVVQDDRFISYLMTSDFQGRRPLRNERRIQRNKAIIMSFLAVVVLLWLLFRVVL
jgi:hypothetical protein